MMIDPKKGLIVWWSSLLLLLLLSVPSGTVVNAFVLPSQQTTTTTATTTTETLLSSSSSSTASSSSSSIQQQRIVGRRVVVNHSFETRTVLLSSLPLSEKDSSNQDDNNDEYDDDDEVEEGSGSPVGEVPVTTISMDDGSDDNEDDDSSSSDVMVPDVTTTTVTATEETTTTTTTNTITSIGTDLTQVEDVQVQTLDKVVVTVGEVMETVTTKTKSSTIIMSCLSHYGDYNAWELTQQYMSAIQGGRLDEDCQLVLVGIGSVEAANTFAKDIGLMDDPLYQDRITLVTDEEGRITEALDCYRGWLTPDRRHRERYPQSDIPPALKLLGMIAGLGSPGTIPSVLLGYTGDVRQDYGPFGRRWVVQALQQGSRKGRFPQVEISLDDQNPKKDLRPFELATLRLQTGLHIVAKWAKLGPKDGDLFTRMGGTFVFSAGQCIWERFDMGILNFANMDDICQVAEAAVRGNRFIPSTNSRTARETRQRFWTRKDEEAKKRDIESARRAEEARIEQERVAEKAKRAEMARLEELDRIEQERIAEIARQGQEAVRLRLEKEAEEEARLAEEAAKVAAAEELERAEVEAKAAAEEERAVMEKKKAAEEDEVAAEEVVDVSATIAAAAGGVDKTEMVPPEDEAQTPIVAEQDEALVVVETELESMMGETLLSVETVPVETPEEDDMVDSVEVMVEFGTETVNGERDSTTEAVNAPLDPVDEVILKAEEQEKKLWASLEALKMAPRSDSQKSSSPTSDAFQRRLLAARIQYESAVTKAETAMGDAGDAESTSYIEEITSSSEDLVHGTLNGIFSEKPAEEDSPVLAVHSNNHNGFKVQNEQEMFQRKLLAARLKYEQSTS